PFVQVRFELGNLSFDLLLLLNGRPLTDLKHVLFERKVCSVKSRSYCDATRLRIQRNRGTRGDNRATDAVPAIVCPNKGPHTNDKLVLLTPPLLFLIDSEQLAIHALHPFPAGNR